MQLDRSAIEAARKRQHHYAAARGTSVQKKAGGVRRTRQVDETLIMNAIRHEGPEVMSTAGKGYWKDMEKRHPEIKVQVETAAPTFGYSRQFAAGYQNIFDRAPKK